MPERRPQRSWLQQFGQQQAWRQRLRRRHAHVVLPSALALLVAPLATPAGAQLPRSDAAVAQARPASVSAPATTRVAAAPVNFLLIGTDFRRSEPRAGAALSPSAAASRGRADTMMLVHLPADRRSAQVVSLPRDAWVLVPGRGMAKLNSAYAWGGAPLLVQTLQRLTGVPISHTVVVDFAGFLRINQALGGVTVATESGPKVLRGVTALDFVRARSGLPRGDLDRVQRQQAYLRATMRKVFTPNVLANPTLVGHIVNLIASSVRLNGQLAGAQVRDLAASLSALQANRVTFTTAPVLGTGRVGRRSVVRLDVAAGLRFWPAFGTGRTAALVGTPSADTLGASVQDPVRRPRPLPKATPPAVPLRPAPGPLIRQLLR